MTYLMGMYELFPAGYGCIDILQDGIHKAWGLVELLKRWNLKPEQIMAFGDSEMTLNVRVGRNFIRYGKCRRSC